MITSILASQSISVLFNLHYIINCIREKGEIKQRKQIVNAFIRQALFYDDEIVITYTFTDNPEHLKKTKESSLKTEKSNRRNRFFLYREFEYFQPLSAKRRTMRIVIRQLPYYDSHFFTYFSSKYRQIRYYDRHFHCFALLCLTFLAYKYYAYHNYYVGHSTYKYAILSISSPVFSAEKGFLQRVFRYSRRCFIISRDIRPAFFHSCIFPKKKRRKKPVAIS